MMFARLPPSADRKAVALQMNYARPIIVMITSMILMPMNGTMIPPKP
jgi:hypothetical protein